MLSLIRWVFDPLDSWQAQVDCLRTKVLTQRRELLNWSSASYAARQDLRLWLSAIAPKHTCDLLEARFPKGPGVDIERSTEDPLTRPEAQSYLFRLHETTNLAFDLLTGGQLRSHQHILTHAACTIDAPSEVELAGYLDQHSTTHRLWTDETREWFWTGFYQPHQVRANERLSYPGHWLWNVVIGWHPTKGEDAEAILRKYGAD